MHLFDQFRDLSQITAIIGQRLRHQRRGNVILFSNRLQDSPHRLLDRGGGYAVLAVIGQLFAATTFSLVNAGLHGSGDLIGIHQHPAIHVTGSPAAGLDQGTGRAQEPFLIRIQNRHQ